MSYIGTEPKDIRSFGRTKFDYTATQGQTAFTGADDDGKVLAFTVGQIEVYVNGILMDDSDFTTTGTGTVTLASAANLNDVINIVSFESNIPDNDYVPASGGTFSGNVTHSGTVAHTGDVTITGNANDANGNLKVTTNTPTNYPAMVIETSTGGNSTEVHGLHIKNTAAGHGLRIDDESSDTTPFVVTSDGKVGVGTTSPLRQLSALSTTGNAEVSLVSGTSNQCSILMGDGTTGTDIYKGYLQYDNNTDKMLIATNATSRINIDSAGRVTMPYQPAFMCYKNSSSHLEASGHNRVQGWTEHFDVGSHFDNSTGRFVAPVAGKYFFTFNAMHSGTVSGDLQFKIYKNGNEYIKANDTSDGGSWDQCTVVAIMDMAVNDYAEPYQYSNTNSNSEAVYAGKYSAWMGYLLG